ncbi:MAG: hypothetical protein H6618_01325 [Deltaproteobacteria bacterium]|nr:hypothetical protein [Deltaproteobacteria bacterium]
MNSRFNNYDKIRSEINGLTKEELTGLLAKAKPIHSGIGGSSVVIEIAATPIFVKKIPITKLEIRKHNSLSTANIYNLPLYYQYGVGSAGFGAWRELRGWQIATDMVQKSECSNFPILFGHRIIEGQSKTVLTVEEKQKIDSDWKYWNCSDQIRSRLEDLALSKSFLYLFLEFIPQTLFEWLGEKIKENAEEGVNACTSVLAKIPKIAASLRSKDFCHFDAHFWNLLTDGAELFLGDLGLCLSSEFDLSKNEKNFLSDHDQYDHACLILNLMHSIVAHLHGVDRWKDYIESNENNLDFHGYQQIVNELLPVAKRMHRFLTDLQANKTTPYPKKEIAEMIVI